ncbi:MAG: hypothetical protein JXM71_02555 [Spirochaetales bacterium]|nr:hypothetical protein [Spirochaetales bacterium]
MERVSEKSEGRGGFGATIKRTLDTLAVISVLAVLTGAALTAAGVSWRARAYVSIVSTLFDVIFAYEFIARSATRERPFPWLYGLSSVLPLLAVSGPFIAGWLMADVSATAVRGFWLGPAPLGGLSTLAALRLLRVIRPFQGNYERNLSSKDSARKLAASIGLAVVLVGSLASDAFLLPSMARAAAYNRNSTASALAAIDDMDDLKSAASAAGALAVRSGGVIVIPATVQLSPSDYARVSSGTLELWLPTRDERRARGVLEAVAALASLAAALAFALANSVNVNVSQGVQDGVRRAPGSQATSRRLRSRYNKAEASFHDRPKDVPAGTEELAGILGKR